ncbi:hypothetical protein [Okeania sp.]|uniref:type II toxin-antitoxin system RelN family antitoxin n=1 Tax=Okeania sp. TaxID=3100323 RepID=UPI002B4B81CF|nr:hypothetical protein [Okeania sp.]MEB3340854.1 hypothetical protein [Okeania sp.]
MKAIEATGIIDEKGQLFLDQPIENSVPVKVRVILLFTEITAEIQPEFDDTSVAEIKASLTRALQEAKSGQTRPVSQLWERIDAE